MTNMDGMEERDKLEKVGLFHGHLGPCVVTGLRLGDYALKRLKAHAHYGIEAWVQCAGRTPESCILDGIQVSTGCTLGKQNLHHLVGSPVIARFRNRDTGEEVVVAVNAEKVQESMATLRREGEPAAVSFVLGLAEEDLFAELPADQGPS